MWHNHHPVATTKCPFYKPIVPLPHLWTHPVCNLTSLLVLPQKEANHRCTSLFHPIRSHFSLALPLVLYLYGLWGASDRCLSRYVRAPKSSVRSPRPAG